VVVGQWSLIPRGRFASCNGVPGCGGEVNPGRSFDILTSVFFSQFAYDKRHAQHRVKSLPGQLVLLRGVFCQPFLCAQVRGKVARMTPSLEFVLSSCLFSLGPGAAVDDCFLCENRRHDGKTSRVFSFFFLTYEQRNFPLIRFLEFDPPVRGSKVCAPPTPMFFSHLTELLFKLHFIVGTCFPY